MIPAILMLGWVWTAGQTEQLLVPLVMLAVRQAYTRPKVKLGLALPLSTLSFLVAFAFWTWVTKLPWLAAIVGAKAGLSSLIVVRSFTGLDRLVNPITIRIPVARDCLFVVARWFSAVSDVLHDVRYTYVLESKRKRLPKLTLLFRSLVVVVIELLELIDRLDLVVSARGSFPGLPRWLAPCAQVRTVVIADAVLVLFAAVAAVVAART